MHARVSNAIYYATLRGATTFSITTITVTTFCVTKITQQTAKALYGVSLDLNVVGKQIGYIQRLWANYRYAEISFD